jgi:hypothetical protein
MPTQNTGDQMMVSLDWSYNSAPVHTSHCKTFITTSIRKALKDTHTKENVAGIFWVRQNCTNSR